jgi:hypothetical protein
MILPPGERYLVVRGDAMQNVEVVGVAVYLHHLTHIAGDPESSSDCRRVVRPRTIHHHCGIRGHNFRSDMLYSAKLWLKGLES